MHHGAGDGQVGEPFGRQTRQHTRELPLPRFGLMDLSCATLEEPKRLAGLD